MPSEENHPLRSFGTTPVKWTRSALTSVLLALVAIAPAASMAAEPDTSQEGGGSPEQVLDPDSDSPTFDPGGDTELPYDTGSPSASPEDSPDAVPLEGEPLDDPEGRAAPFAEPQTPAPSSQEDSPASPLEEAPPAAPAPGFSVDPPPTTSAPPAPTAIPPESLGAEQASRPKARRQTWTVVASVHSSPSEQVEVTADPDMPAVVNAETTAPATRPVAARPPKSKGDARIHIVRRGESLWSIAQGLLGSDASAKRVAAEVARLWELNRDRIPSGDPDLLAVGQQLRLR